MIDLRYHNLVSVFLALAAWRVVLGRTAPEPWAPPPPPGHGSCADLQRDPGPARGHRDRRHPSDSYIEVMAAAYSKPGTLEGRDVLAVRPGPRQ